MSKSLYVTAIEPDSGKSLVALGIANVISHRVNKMGIFRPVIRDDSTPDNDTELIRTQFSIDLPYESSYAATYSSALDMVSTGNEQELLKLILAKYKQLEAECDFVVCLGTDFTGISSAFELGFDAGVANHLGCPILMVGSGQGKTVEETYDIVRSAYRSLANDHCTVTATFVNQVPIENFEAVQTRFEKGWPQEEPLFVIPECKELAAPTIGEIASALNGKVLEYGSQDLYKEVLEYKIAAMQLENFLQRIEDGSLIITPGDRVDIIVGCMASLLSQSFPNIAGLVLTGGFEPSPEIVRLIEGITNAPVPIIAVQPNTHATSMQIDSVKAVISSDNQRKIAMALNLFEESVDTEALVKRIELSRPTVVTPLMFEYMLIDRAKANRQHIVLPEGYEDRILKASEILLRRKVAEITLLGDLERIQSKVAALGLDLSEVHIIDPETSDLRQQFAQQFSEMRKDKGMTFDIAEDMMQEVNYFGTMMVQQGLADGMVSGSVHTTAHTIRPAFQIIKTKENCKTASSAFFMCLADRVLVYGDCAINPNPNSQQLADIAIASAETAAMFGIEPRVAMLSYSTGKSGQGEDVDRVSQATEIAQSLRPDLKIEGPIQYDAAIDVSVASTKLPDSSVAGHATVFIFPDLNTGNNTYKAVQRSAGALAVGPVLQGLRKPVNDLSRGCTVPDIVNTVAITAVQAHVMKQQQSL